MSSDPKLVPYILPLIEGRTILDIGCGYGNWGYLIKTAYWYTKAGRKRKKANFLMGIDICKNYLKFVNYHRVYSETAMCDSRYLPLNDKTFDTVLLLEIIEHLPKSEGYNILKEAERVAKRLVIVSTPSYFIRQETRDGNKFQKHLSKWTVSDFKRAGYTIVMGSFIMERFYNYLQYFFLKFTYVLPQYPVSVIAVKRLK